MHIMIQGCDWDECEFYITKQGNAECKLQFLEQQNIPRVTLKCVF